MSMIKPLNGVRPPAVAKSESASPSVAVAAQRLSRELHGLFSAHIKDAFKAGQSTCNVNIRRNESEYPLEVAQQAVALVQKRLASDGYRIIDLVVVREPEYAPYRVGVIEGYSINIGGMFGKPLTTSPAGR